MQGCGIVLQNRNGYGPKIRHFHSADHVKRRLIAEGQRTSGLHIDTSQKPIEPLDRIVITGNTDTPSSPVKAVEPVTKSSVTPQNATPKAESIKTEINDYCIHSQHRTRESEPNFDWAACISFFSFMLVVLALLVLLFLCVSPALVDILWGIVATGMIIGFIFLSISRILMRYFGMPETNYNIAAEISALILGMAAAVAYIVLIYKLLFVW